MNRFKQRKIKASSHQYAFKFDTMEEFFNDKYIKVHNNPEYFYLALVGDKVVRVSKNFDDKAWIIGTVKSLDGFDLPLWHGEIF